MKIMVDAFAARGGGGKWFTSALISQLALQNKKWCFHVYCSDSAFANSFSSQLNVNLRLIPDAGGYKSRTIWQQIKLRQILKEDRFDLLFSPLNIGMINPPVPQVTVQRNAHHVVPKVTPRNGGGWPNRRIQLLGTLASIKSSTENVFVSRHLLDMARKWLHEDRAHWHVIHNAVNADRFNIATDPEFDEPYLLYVGIITPHKNVDTLIKAYAMVRRQLNNRGKLILAGNISKAAYRGFGRWDEYLKNLVRKLDLQRHVVFLNSVKGKQLVSLYTHASLCLAPSFLESFGVVPAEALFCGTPCLVSDIPVFHEVYGGSVAYCDPFSKSDIARVIACLITDDVWRQTMLNHWRQIAPNFSLAAAGEKYAKVFEKALNR